MATPKHEAPTRQQLEEECYGRILTRARLSIEEKIRGSGQLGFVEPFYLGQHHDSPNHLDTRHLAEKVLSQILSEYRSVGWTIAVSNENLEDWSVWLTFS
jgi:hypothetical protein